MARTWSLTDLEYLPIKAFGALPDTPSGQALVKQGGLYANATVTGSSAVMGEWISNYTYSINNLVSYNGVIYKSLQNTNLNQQPDISPTYWTIWSSELDATTVTDPATNYFSALIIDRYAGVIVTTTTAPSGTFTLSNPTVNSIGKSFIIVNNDTSTDPIKVNVITILPGVGAKFMYDGTAWVHVNSANASDINFTPTINNTATNVQSAISNCVTISQLSPQTIGLTGSRLAKLWATDLQTTNAPIIDALTASEILASGASKEIVSLDTATYPSLTELSYIKGVTSGIQSQIGGLVPYIGATTDLDLGLHNIVSNGQKVPRSNGLVTIPTFTDLGTGNVTIGGCDCVLTSATDNTGITQKFTVTGNTFALTDQVNNYIVINYNSGTPIMQNITDVTLIDEILIIPVFTLFRDGTEVHAEDWDALGISLVNKLNKSIVKTQRFRRQSGFGLSEVATRVISIDAGEYWRGGVDRQLVAYASNVNDCDFYYHVGGVWNKSVITQYNNTQYDDGTNLVTLGAGRYAVNYIYKCGSINHNDAFVVLGGGNYTLTQAQNSQPPSSLPPLIQSFGILVGRIIVQKNDSAATQIDSAFVTTFTPSPSTDHSGLSNLGWTVSGHTGTATTLAGFDGTGIASFYTLNGTGTVIPTTASPTIVSPTFSTSINGSYLTASQILGTDASKNIVSLPVATYPSLTELSYVKGVTSAIQTQLNAKRSTALTAYSDLYAPQGFLINGKIVRTVASNNLTVAIKTLAGTDPSATDPVYVRTGNTVRSITSALSVSAAAATNWFNAGSTELATKEIDYQVLLGYNATDGVVIGFSRYFAGRVYSDFSTTTTNEKYCAISTITHAAATDEYECIGRFNATLSAGAGYTWSIPATDIIINRPIFETRWLDWGGVTSWNGTAPTGIGANVKMRYKIRNNDLYVDVYKINMVAGANNTLLTITLPFNLYNPVADNFSLMSGYIFATHGTPNLSYSYVVNGGVGNQFLVISSTSCSATGYSSSNYYPI